MFRGIPLAWRGIIAGHFLGVAFVSAPTFADEIKGFHSHDSVECEPVADIARQSTYRIVLPTLEQALLKDLVGNDTLETRLNLIERLRSRHQAEPWSDDLNAWQIETCVQQKSENCLVSKTFTSASMVLVGEGDEALTAFHNIKTILNAYLLDWYQKGLSPSQIALTLNHSFLPILVYDYNGKLVASPTDLSVQMQGITSEQIEMALRMPFTADFHSAFDQVSLKFSRKIGIGAKIAARRPALKETVHLFGFPTATGGSDGHTFYCTVGEVITPEEAAARTQWNLASLSPIEDMLYRQQTIFSSNDAASGNSGGPLFNERGEVIAVLSRGNTSVTDSVATAKVVIPPVSIQATAEVPLSLRRPAQN